MNLHNVNLYDRWRIEKYDKYLNEKPVTKGLEWVLNKVSELPDGLKLVELPSQNGKFLKMLRERTSLERFERILAYEERLRLANLNDVKGKNIQHLKINPVEEKKFRVHKVDVLVSINHLPNEVKPVEWINKVLELFDTKNVFIVFDIEADDVSFDLKEENYRIQTLFTAGKYIKNQYNVKALNEIASQTGLELQIIRDYDGDSAILYRTEKRVAEVKPEPVTEKPKKKKLKKVDKKKES